MRSLRQFSDVGVWEGTRPLLVEFGLPVDHSMMANPRRVAVGLEQEPSGNPAGGAAPTRRSANVTDQDVFVNVVGGVKVTETSADLKHCWRWSQPA